MIRNNNIDSKLHNNENVNYDLAVVTGLPRSGKSLLSPIVSSFKRSENFNMEYLLEQIPMLNFMGKMSDDAVIYLFRYAIDLILYNNKIGRNTNLRFGDETSIWNTKSPIKYLRRLFSKEGSQVYREIEKEVPIFILVLHSALYYANILFKTFPSLKILQCDPHPVDLIYAWHSKSYGSNIYGKQGIQLLSIKWGDEILPFYAYGWEEEYSKLSEIDRIVYMISSIKESEKKNFNLLSKRNKDKIFFVNYDDLLINTELVVNNIVYFLNTRKTLYTHKTLNSSDISSRKFAISQREKKYTEIKQIISDSSMKTITRMIDNYESKNE